MTTIIISGLLVFLLIIFLLTAVILFAKQKLVASGLVKIRINGEKELSVNPGSSLLSTLAGDKIFLSSACGGKGTCAYCKCKVFSGGGAMLATEEPYFTRRQKEEYFRLACQVKVKHDLDIQIPEEIFGIKKWVCTVTSNKNVATFIKEFLLKLPEGEEIKFKNGGYIQIDIPPYEVDFSKDLDVETEYRPDWDALNIWSLKVKNEEEIFRAYSMANHPAEGNRVMLNVRIATPPWDRAKKTFAEGIKPGISSSYIFSRKPGDKVVVSGPYGEFFLQETNREMVFVGGGAGMAPLRSHIFHLFHTEKTKRKATYFYGARSMREIFYEDEFRAIEKEFPNFKFVIALSEPLPSDNWQGPVGFIHQVTYDTYLKNHPAPEDIEYYLCGPPLMNKAVLKMLDDLGVDKEMIRLDEF
ncbi:MAG: NADH:ubiquinone reductase (Na(+)-transporting) subunit F [Bacteroidetes bacterium]|nr:NADH:ubiquinone reductase (Na(+)-transporting) subunit F [Bacteroidota bacterium]